MNISLLTNTEHIQDMVNFATTAALTCHANTDKDIEPQELLLRIIGYGHESVLEHINLTYSIKGLSRACLQELARHRHISLSVESTRHTIRKQATEDFVFSTFSNVYEHTKAMGFVLFADAHPDMPNDELKYFLPEFWPTNLILTSNVRALRHIIKLRTAPQALAEFRDLAFGLCDVLPEKYKYLLWDCVYKNE